MKTYLVSVDPKLLYAVVASMQQQHINIKQQLDAIATLVILCTEDDKSKVQNMPGVLAIEEEGSSFVL